MKYQSIYDALILKRQRVVPSGYVEQHHIFPKGLGGSNNKDNIVSLTAREHFVAHLLLHKIYNRKETAFALWMMQCKSPDHNGERNYICNSRMYEWARNEFVKYYKGHNYSVGRRNSQYGTRWICSIDLKENKKIPKNQKIPDGWIAGRNKWKLKSNSAKKESYLKTLKMANDFIYGNYSSYAEYAKEIGVHRNSIGKRFRKFPDINEKIKSALVTRKAR